MKVALIVPPAAHSIESSVSPELEEDRGTYPPLGLLYVAAAAEAWANAEVTLIDCLAAGVDLAALRTRVTGLDVSVVGFSAMTFNLLDVIEAARIVKEMRPDITTIVGGAHATLYPLETLRLPDVDFVMAGESERSFPQFLRLLEAGDTDGYSRIPGLAYKRDGGVRINGDLDWIEDLDALPWPARGLLDHGQYQNLIGAGGVSTTLQSSRGCPFGCTFCDMRRSRFRARSPKSVVDEVESLVNSGIRDLFFIDDTLTIDKRRLMETLDLMIERRLPAQFKISARADTLTPEILSRLKKAGCYRVHVGVESGTQRLLDYLGKGVTTDRVARAFRDLREARLEGLAYCMVGIPGETRAEMSDTVRFAVSLRPRYAQFSVCTPYPKTALYAQLLGEGVIPYDYWQEFADNPKPDFSIRFWNRDFTDDELRRIQREVHREFYARPSYVLHELFAVRSFRDLARKAKVGVRLLRG